MRYIVEVDGARGARELCAGTSTKGVGYCARNTGLGISGQREGKANGEEGQDGPPDTNESALVTNSGKRVQFEDLRRPLSITTSRGLQPSLEGKTLSREIVQTFLRDYQGYASSMIEGVVDGIPKRPVGLCELIDEDQRRVLSNVHNEGRFMTEEQERGKSDRHHEGYAGIREGIEGMPEDGSQGLGEGPGA